MPSGKHDTGVATDKWFGMSMEISEHGVAFPTADNTDLVGVKATKQEGHGTAGSERASSDFGWVHSSMAWNSKRGYTENAGDHSGGDSTLCACLIIVDMERCVGRRIVL